MQFFEGTFHDMSEEARRTKKPIVLVILAGAPESDEPVLSVYSALSGNQQFLNDHYITFGVY